MVQTYEPWWPLAEPVAKRFLSAELTISFPDAHVRLDPGHRDGAALGASVLIDFPNVAAAMMHEEFVHPLNATNDGPAWPEGVHVAIVRDSEWIRSFTDSQLLMYKKPVHYRIVTNFPVIDIICIGTPSARSERAQPDSG